MMITLGLIFILAVAGSPPSYKDKAATARWMAENNLVSQLYLKIIVNDSLRNIFSGVQWLLFLPLKL